MEIKAKIKILALLLVIFCLGLNASSVLAYRDNNNLNKEVKSLNNEISSSKKKLEELDREKKKYTQNINTKRQEAVNLKNQVSILENRIARTGVEIEEIEIEMSKAALEIKKTTLEIKKKEKEIKKERKDISNTLNLIYQENNINTLEIILLNDSLTDFLDKVKYLEDINKEMGDSLDNLKDYKEELDEDKISLKNKSEELINLKEDLEQKRLAMESEKRYKTFLIEETKNSEQNYQRLLVLAKEEQQAAALEIAQMENEVRQKIKEISQNSEKKDLEFNDNGFIWPVTKNYITVYFHDPEYPFRYIFEHPAIDIRAKQGTTLKAAASGYVARSKIQGTSYGYIMIIHGDGLSTVYGHASASFVEEDEYVVQGQAIGRSGGMPGTRGSGRLTTGPHLHFEVRKDGIPVNPLNYLK